MFFVWSRSFLLSDGGRVAAGVVHEVDDLEPNVGGASAGRKNRNSIAVDGQRNMCLCVRVRSFGTHAMVASLVTSYSSERKLREKGTRVAAIKR